MAETITLAEGIINRGRGPEIAGSRITVYDVFDEMNAGRTIAELANDWSLSVEQIECAVRYIEAHREDVEYALDGMKIYHRAMAEECRKMDPALRALRHAPTPENLQRWELAKADWILFQHQVWETQQRTTSEPPDDPYVVERSESR